jgi:tyrosyl-tRNA synthetase
MAASDGSEQQFGKLTANAEHVVPAEDLMSRLKEGRPLRVKLGLDPTARDVTLGWAVPLRKLRQFQDEGHTAVLIVGDFTARIGDPSGRSATRPRLSPDVVRANAEACVAMLLDVLSEENLELRYNSEWLGRLDLEGVLRLTSHYTVARMLERNDFAARFKDQRPISLIEFLYPLCQAYDSVAVEADVELGGTDQLFNLLVGRDLQGAYGQRPQIALTMPLLEGLDGVHAMSQSRGNYVSIRDAPAEMFGKLMSIPDHLVGRYAALAADLGPDEASALERASRSGGPQAGRAKRTMARGVVAIYHGDASARAAEASFDRQFRHHAVPEGVPEAQIPPGAVEGAAVHLPRVLAELGLTSSRGEARRLISQGGVRLDGDAVQSEHVPVDALRGAVMQVGKRRFVRLTG